MRLGSDQDRRSGNVDVRGFGGGRGQEINTKVLDPRILEKELKLEWKQKDEVEQIFREYEAAVDDLRKKSQGNQNQMEKERLEQELKMARQSRDVQRAAEILGKLREFRTDVSDEEREMREQLIEEIEKVLNEGQKIQFRRMLRPSEAGGAPPPLEDPKVLFQCLEQVKLQPFQKTQLDQLKKQHDDDMQRRTQMGQKMSPEEEKMVQKRLMDQVLMVLDDEQEKELRAVHARMGGGATAGSVPVDMKNPRALQFALMQLNNTNNRLDQQQMTEMSRIRSEYYRQLRETRDDEDARARLDEQVSQQIVNLLRPEQKEALEKMQVPSSPFMGGRFGRSDRDGRRSDRMRGGLDRSGGVGGELHTHGSDDGRSREPGGLGR